MKIHINHLKRFIKDDIDPDELSEKFMQLGHENTYQKGIFDLEITPNRGDCLSIKGILRELNNLYNVNTSFKTFDGKIEELNFNFINNSENDCPVINFLHIEVDKIPSQYKSYLQSYFDELNINKNNFFTDISNYVSYEQGNPTHCYDLEKVGDQLVLEKPKDKVSFKTLTGKNIDLCQSDLVFTNGKNVLNLAGVMGGESTSCDNDTKKVLIECAFFKPKSLIGKSIKYDLNSEAAYKFERGVDSLMLENTLRRFISIVEDHAKITNLSLYQKIYQDYESKYIKNDKSKVESILGIEINDDTYTKILENLGFRIDEMIIIPSFRHDVEDLNHIAEEVARVIGYNKIPLKNLDTLPKEPEQNKSEDMLRLVLANKGFYETINYPFESEEERSSLKLDNPLDSNKPFLRTSIANSLIRNLEYNERRQKDSIKLFEISNLYESENDLIEKRKLGIIMTGRIGQNYEYFNKFIDLQYFKKALSEISEDFNDIKEIPRSIVNSKNNTKIFFAEIDLCNLSINQDTESLKSFIKFNNIVYTEISEYPSTKRDLSFLIKDNSKKKVLLLMLESFNNKLLKEKFMFDLYKDPKSGNIKVGYRFIFQSDLKTLTDEEVDKVINAIVESSLEIDGIEIPGLMNNK
tara:strand:- start:4686 stop:6593 length:1908 start_codon:yes stop_codon:yes gene_type:complete